MGKGIGGDPEAPAVGGDAGGREPIGRYIAQQRRLRGIELDEVAARTRIPRRSLERLEAGAFDLSPDGFSRGFVRTVAEAIGLDPDDAVARMLPEPDAAQRGSPRAGRVLGALAGLAALAGVALLVRALVLAPEAPVGHAADGELALRRDFVSALAEAQGIDPSALGARAAVLPPLPAEVPAPAALAEAGDAAAEPAEGVGSAPASAAAPVAARPAPATADAPPTPVVTAPLDSPPPASASATDAPPAPVVETLPAPPPTPSPDAEADD